MVTRPLFSRPLLLKHEPLFKWEDKDDNVLIHKYEIYQWDLYAIGYKYAADLAVDQAAKEHSIDFAKYHNIYRTVDVLVWPAIFLYRQYLELRLKAIIIRGTMLKSCEEGKFPDERDMDLKTIHTFRDFWPSCKSVIKNLHPDADQEDLKELETMEKYIYEFSKLDEGSYTFRYPVNKKKRPWDYEKYQFSLNNLKAIMDKIYSYLEDQNNSLDGAIDFEKECLREAYS